MLAGYYALRSPRLQVDAGLLAELLSGSLPPAPPSPPPRPMTPPHEPTTGADEPSARAAFAPAAKPLAPAAQPPAPAAPEPDVVTVKLRPADTLNGVAQDVERQFFRHLFRETGGDFGRMAHHLLGDAEKARAVRLRFNQLGLSARALRGP